MRNDTTLTIRDKNLFFLLKSQILITRHYLFQRIESMGFFPYISLQHDSSISLV